MSKSCAEIARVVLVAGLLAVSAFMLFAQPGTRAFSSAAPASRRVSLCDGPHINARVRCYPPSQVGLAERQMPVAVISPRGLVWRVTGLRLREVDVDGSAAMDYLFGRLPPGPFGLPGYGSVRPHYMIVREITGGPRNLAVNVYRMQGGADWHFSASVRGRDLELHIFTNVGRVAVERVGYKMLRLGSAGGK
jgi:hypothetical protein